jgi:hypothetical protein
MPVNESEASSFTRPSLELLRHLAGEIRVTMCKVRHGKHPYCHLPIRLPCVHHEASLLLHTALHGLNGGEHARPPGAPQNVVQLLLLARVIGAGRGGGSLRIGTLTEISGWTAS